MNHIADADLERYSMGLVTDEAELAAIEEHLLWCQSCIDRAEATDRFVNAIKTELSRRARTDSDGRSSR